MREVDVTFAIERNIYYRKLITHIPYSALRSRSELRIWIFSIVDPIRPDGLNFFFDYPVVE